VKPIFRRNKSGVTRIVRDSYSNKNAGTSWYEISKAVKVRDMYCCVSCKTPEKPKLGVYHEVHHIKPLSRGGTTTKANLITLCKACHDRRHPHLSGRSRSS
jgi:5-methylcytosine-specific restriction protein A